MRNPPSVQLIEKRTPTRAHDVYTALRADILNGQLLPGRKLRFQSLGERYMSSVGAIREALTRLVSEQLVTVAPRQGYRVTTLDSSDFEDLVDARVEIESLVVYKSVEAGDVAWESQLVAAHHALNKVPFTSIQDATHPTSEWAEAHRTFHLALGAACKNRRLLEYATALRERAILYQVWSVSSDPASTPGKPEQRRASEHDELLSAALERDSDLAAALTRRHIRETSRIVSHTKDFTQMTAMSDVVEYPDSDQ